MQRIGYIAAFQGQRKKLASSSAHAPEKQPRIGLRRKGDCDCKVVVADCLYQIEGVLRIAVQIHQHYIEAGAKNPRHLVKGRRICDELLDGALVTVAQRACYALRSLSSGLITATDKMEAFRASLIWTASDMAIPILPVAWCISTGRRAQQVHRLEPPFGYQFDSFAPFLWKNPKPS